MQSVMSFVVTAEFECDLPSRYHVKIECGIAFLYLPSVRTIVIVNVMLKTLSGS